MFSSRCGWLLLLCGQWEGVTGCVRSGGISCPRALLALSLCPSSSLVRGPQQSPLPLSLSLCHCPACLFALACSRCHALDYPPLSIPATVPPPLSLLCCSHTYTAHTLTHTTHSRLPRCVVVVVVVCAFRDTARAGRTLQAPPSSPCVFVFLPT